MAIELTGLSTQSYEEVLDAIILAERESVSDTIDVSDDTGLGQTNQIMAQRIALVNEGIQDVYDQRDINKAEGKALDDNVSWMGLRRQSKAATAGELNFTGDNGTIIPAGSYVQNQYSLETYTTDAVIVITKDSARDITFSVINVLDTTLYSVEVQGISFDYTSDSDATDLEIIAGLVAKINLVPDEDFTATDNLDGTGRVDALSVGGDFPKNLLMDVSDDLDIDSVTSAGLVTATVKDSIAAPVGTVTTILSPVNGLTSVINTEDLIIGRARETDSELRDRAITFRSASGKATVDAVIGELLNVTGVASVAVNEQLVSQAMGDWRITVDTVVDTTAYTVTINGLPYTYTSDASATADEIAQGLVAAINVITAHGLIAIDDTATFTGQLSVTSNLFYNIDLSVDANMSYLEGQPAGSIQAVVAGGDDDTEVAQAIWDTKPAGVEVWALNNQTIVTESVIDINGTSRTVSFNRPTSITNVVEVRYKTHDLTVYPELDETAYAAIREAIVVFGNLLGAGQDIAPKQFEGSVYGAVGGIYDVYIEITANTAPTQTVASDDRDGVSDFNAEIDSAEEAFFATSTITVINET